MGMMKLMADTIPIHGVRNRVAKNGPAIREALRPDDREMFVAELRIALALADDSLDLVPVAAVIDKWWGRAVLTANPEIEAGALADRRRLEAGDLTVLGGTTSYPGGDSEVTDPQVHDPLGHLRRATA
ncbi:hypothetical protein FF36_05965 [Frankia torreyi]|uniref:Uncharacterized protein n=3 Tax=Frankiaceae TaxID=74712 RepID=A0A0D8B6H4_9ACTN|nr:hypothetical protein FF36_05965 [Frankia torreyi]KQM02247.1 hypothetical protein FF86_10748 [Frankia sp. CpI1-P]